MASNPYSKLGKKINNANKKQQQRLDNAYKNQVSALNNSTKTTVDYLKKQKTYADKDFRNAKSSAYTDMVKTINPYGAAAESQVSQGLGNSGFSESSRVNANNARQVKISNAYDTNTKAKLEFDNSIAEARNSNSSKLADLAFKKAEMKNANTQNALQSLLSLANSKADYKYKYDVLKKTSDGSGGSGGSSSRSGGSRSGGSRSGGSRGGGSRGGYSNNSSGNSNSLTSNSSKNKKKKKTNTWVDNMGK